MLGKVKRHKISREEKRAILAEFTLMDDIFMRVVLQDVKCTEYILKVLMEKKIKVKEQHLQMDLKNLQGRSLLLDCLCEDEDGKLYNIEMQNDLEGASPKRARYHASLLDMHSLDAGEKFTQLPESYVIFIVKKDILNLQKQIYYVDRRIRDSEEYFSDGSHIIYLNTEITEENAFGDLVRDFQRKNPQEMHSSVLARRVKELKESSMERKGGPEMNMALEKLLAVGREERREEGESRAAQLMGLLAEQGRLEDIKKASLDQEFRKQLLRELKL